MDIYKRIVKGIASSTVIVLLIAVPTYVLVDIVAAKIEINALFIFALACTSIFVVAAFFIGFGWDKKMTDISTDKLLAKNLRDASPYIEKALLVLAGILLIYGYLKNA